MLPSSGDPSLAACFKAASSSSYRWKEWSSNPRHACSAAIRGSRAIASSTRRSASSKRCCAFNTQTCHNTSCPAVAPRARARWNQRSAPAKSRSRTNRTCPVATYASTRRWSIASARDASSSARCSSCAARPSRIARVARVRASAAQAGANSGSTPTAVSNDFTAAARSSSRLPRAAAA